MNRIDHYLLTVDEATNLIGTTAIAVADRAPVSLVAQLLAGRGTLRDLDDQTKEAVRAYRSVLRHVRAVGLASLITDQVEGALSYAGVETGAVERAIAA